MRDLFETIPLDDPVTAARRGGRPALRQRFYAAADVQSTAEGYALTLDGKPVRTPMRRPLAAPNLALARAMAAEWDAQHEVIDPATMPLTRLANAIIDGVAEMPGPVAAEIQNYLASDLLFYRASGPQPLCERQAALWDPILAWARNRLEASFKLGQGVVHVAQPDAALKGPAAAIPSDPWRLGAVHVITTLTGSALIALAMAHGTLSADAAWEAAHVDEDWNTAQWGKDDMAMGRRAFRHAEFAAAAGVLHELAE
ncbi:MAG: ATP12 family protein [Xanthobacteraceae bacterium]